MGVAFSVQFFYTPVQAAAEFRDRHAELTFSSQGVTMMPSVPATGVSFQLDRRSEARNILEAIGNLLYLIEVDHSDPDLVRAYTAQAEERVRALDALLEEPAPISAA